MNVNYCAESGILLVKNKTGQMNEENNGCFFAIFCPTWLWLEQGRNDWGCWLGGGGVEHAMKQ